MEAHATATLDSIYDRAKQAVMLRDRSSARSAGDDVRLPAGGRPVPGVYGGLLDKIPFGMVMNKGLTIRTGQTHVNRWTDDLLRRIEDGQIDPSFVITHQVGLEDGPRCTRRSATRRTAASRSCSSSEEERWRYGNSSWGDGADRSTHALARGLGWFSIGLGVAELVVPSQLARFLGMEERTELIRAYGAREIMTGIGILSQEDPTPWIWGRAPATPSTSRRSGLGLRAGNPSQRNVIVAVAAMAGVTMLDAVCAQRLSRQRRTRAANRRRLRARDYSNRRGMLGSPETMRGAARLKSAGGHADSGGLAPLHHKKFA